MNHPTRKPPRTGWRGTRSIGTVLVAFVILFAWLLLGPWGIGRAKTWADATGPVVRRIESGVTYRRRVRDAPRPLRIHVLEVDLQHRGLSLQAVFADDPDGAGPAETVLADPAPAAREAQLIAAVNANAWEMVPHTPAGARPNYEAGAACDVLGWLASGDDVRSPPGRRLWSLWVDADGRAHVGQPDAPVPGARLAVSGFFGLLADGEVVSGRDQGLHPRTAAGIDGTGRRLWLVVVDGRQAGRSEGVTTAELAGIMKGLGCTDALNLDGGGSSIMLARPQPRAAAAEAGDAEATDDNADAGAADDARGMLILNRPSGWGPRPTPVLLGVRQHATEN